MASIVKRTGQRDGSPSYHVKYRAGDGRVHWERYGGAKEAKARKAEVELELARSQGRWTPPVSITLAEYAEQWLAGRGPALRAPTLAEYRRILDRELLPRFGHLPLAAVTRSQLKAYAAERAAEGLSANTIRNDLAPLRALLASAVDDELLRANVAARLARVSRPQRELRPPSARAGRGADRRRTKTGGGRGFHSGCLARPAARRAVRPALGEGRPRRRPRSRRLLGRPRRHHVDEDSGG
jgi:hypothetical protein